MVSKYDGSVGKIVVKVEQPFHFKNLYQFMHLWLLENKFISSDGDSDKYERFYLEKRAQVNEHWIEWDLKREVEGNSYYQYKLNIKVHTLGMKKIEVMQEGKKVKLDHGEIEITLEGEVETDIGGKWEDHWFLKHFKNAYDQRIFKQEFYSMHEVNLYRLMYGLQNMIKKYMAQKCYVPVTSFLHDPANR